MLFLTVLAGVLIWGLLDHFQSKGLKSILYAQQAERLNKEALDARVHFDNYVISYNKAARLITSQKQFSAYLEKKEWLSGSAHPVKYYEEIPPWLPDASVLRMFVRIHYALLLDSNNNVRELYRGWPGPAPRSLSRPDDLLQKLSSGQSFMTALDGSPFVLTAETLTDPKKGGKVTLMLASPLNDSFLISSLGGTNRINIAALVGGHTPTILASSSPDVLPAGTSLASINKLYLITGKSFFDHGASDLTLQFTSLISKDEHERLSAAILAKERRHYAFSALVFIITIALIMLWITRHIRWLAQEITVFSHEVLGMQSKDTRKGDELLILREVFHRLKREVVSSRNALVEEKNNLTKAHEDLGKKNLELDENRRKIQCALDELSSLIQQVSNRKSFDVRFSNPNLVKCYEMTGCENSRCICHGKDAVRCWQVAGTYCLSDPNGEFVDRYGKCENCPVYQEATTDPIYQIGEHFNNMMHILEQQHKELENAYSELKSAQSQMLQREKMASIGQLAAGVAHEINNPMGFILSNLGTFEKYIRRMKEFILAQSELVRTSVSNEAAAGLEVKRRSLKLDYIMEDAAQLLKESLEGAHRVRKIVQGLKTFSRLDEAEYQTVDLNEELESVINILWNELKYKATLKREYGDIPKTVCNPGQLGQVFMNLLVNAADAIEEHGEITVKTWPEAGNIHVSISDTGSGIPEDKLGRIFEPFFTTKEVGKGTGLGLSIAYDIIKKHKGEITVKSEVAKGTLFTIKIPVVEA